MKLLHLFQVSAAVFLCVSGVSCSLFKKKDAGDQYTQDGGYNPYSGQPGQASTYQQYQPSQQYAQQQPQQQPYQSYTPPQDYQPQEEHAPAPKKKSSSSGSSGGSYTVRQGDTLYRIALNHHTTVSKLKSTNGLTSDLIRPGQKLTMP
jgi:LysM domain